MPEAPEVEITVRKLKQQILNLKLIDIDFYCAKFNAVHNDYSTLLKPFLPATVNDVFRKGKYIFIKLILSDGIQEIYLHSHLMMTGRWTWQYNPDNHPRLRLKFGIKNGIINIINKNVYFEDSRTIGKFDIMTLSQVNDMLNKLGPDILNQPLDYDQWWNTLIGGQRNRVNRNICAALMDQETFAGIGNYLKAEILFAARINPNKKVAELNQQQRIDLHYHMYDIPKRSLQSNGLTIRDFWDPDGIKGIFNRLVYDQSTVTINDQIYNVIQGKFADGRNTYYCADFQY